MSLHFAEVSIYISFSANVAPIALWHQLFFITATALISFRQRTQKHEHFGSTRSCAALRAADLDWIVGPEYSLGRNKQKRYPGGVTTDLGGG